MIDRRKVDIAAPNLAVICMDTYGNEEKKGRIYNRYSGQPILLTDLNDLLMEMERLMDRIDFPQSSTKDRFFLKTIKRGKEKGAKQVKTADEILNETGKKATFVVNVQYRQNATWQGKVLWAEKNKSCNFRSALELLKLIDGALDESEVSVQG